MRAHGGQLALGPVDLRDAMQSLHGNGALAGLTQQLVELPPGMRQAARGNAFAVRTDHRVIGRILIAHQGAAPTSIIRALFTEERDRIPRPSPGTEVIDHPRHRIEGASGISPDIRPFGLARPRIEHGYTQ